MKESPELRERFERRGSQLQEKFGRVGLSAPTSFLLTLQFCQDPTGRPRALEHHLALPLQNPKDVEAGFKTARLV